jgi:flagellin
MALSVNTSYASGLNVPLVNQARAMQKTIERLSSGLRINTAADDPAGLTISTRLQSQVRGVNASIRNSLNGFSLFQTGEEALAELQTVLIKMREVTVQSMNDTNNTQDRVILQEEINELVKSASAIVDQSSFNQKMLFDGTYRDQHLQLGESVEESLFVSFQNLTTSYLGRRTVVESSSGVDTAEILIAGEVFTINGEVIRESSATDDLVSTVDNHTSAIAKVAAINASAEKTGVIAYATETRTDGQATLDAFVSDPGDQVYGNTGAVQSIQLSGGTYLEINGAKISGFTVQDLDQDGDLVNAINDFTDETGVYAELNNNYELVLSAPDGRNIALNYFGGGADEGRTLESRIGLKSGNEIEDNAANNGFAYGGGVRLESLNLIDVDFAGEVNTAIGDLAGDYLHSGVQLFATEEENAIKRIALDSERNRTQALKTIDVALDQLNTQRSFLGGLQSRLEHNMNVLEERFLAVSAAYSRVVDADIADETAKLALQQVQSKAFMSVVKEAKDLDAQLLDLLKIDTPTKE